MDRHQLDKIIRYCNEYVLKSELGYYMKGPELGVDNEYLMNSKFAIISNQYIITYFNNIYHDLIVGAAQSGGEDVIQLFNKLNSNKDHSDLCILNLIVSVISKYNMNIDRTLLDISDKEKYLKSINYQFTTIINRFFDLFVERMNHKCEMINMSELDPDTILFY